MEDKKFPDDEEPEKVAGGINYNVFDTGKVITAFVMVCCCGAKIYDTNPVRVDENGMKEIQCTQCGRWNRLQY